MPYKSEKIKLPRELKRNIKLSIEEREELRMQRCLFGTSYNKLAKQFGVSKRLAQFICNPEKEEKNRKLAQSARRSGKYYNREKNTEAVRETRRYKHQLYKKGVI